MPTPAELLAETTAKRAAIRAERFTLTREQALAINAAGPSVALQIAYNTFLHDRARRAAGTIICAPHVELAIAKSWDVHGAEYMAEAQAEFARALAEREAA